MAVRKVTGADVAKVAGVSRATVSYVLNDTPGQTIPQDTRKRVLSAAKRLGYVPNMAGRTLRRGRSDLVVWILPDRPMGSDAGQLIESLSREAGKRRLTLAIVQEDEGVARLETTLRTLSPAAILAAHALPKQVQTYARTTGVPVVSASPLPGEPPAANVRDVADTAREVGQAQVAYLAGRGHTQIAYLYPDDPRVQHLAECRFAGAKAAAKGLGLPALHKRTATLDRGKLCDIARQWRDAGVTAVCTYNDEWAMGLLSAMHLAGLAAPGDLAVIGCDNVHTAPVASPPLTTIDQDIEHAAVTMLHGVEIALGLCAPDHELPPARIRVVPRESA